VKELLPTSTAKQTYQANLNVDHRTRLGLTVNQIQQAKDLSASFTKIKVTLKVILPIKLVH